MLPPEYSTSKVLILLPTSLSPPPLTLKTLPHPYPKMESHIRVVETYSTYRLYPATAGRNPPLRTAVGVGLSV